jgi:hypothetical protein
MYQDLDAGNDNTPPQCGRRMPQTSQLSSLARQLALDYAEWFDRWTASRIMSG